MRHKIVYLVHGEPGFHDQARYSALTLLALLLRAGEDQIGIHVYTDRPELVPVHPLIVAHPLDPAQMRVWRGPLDYVHRIKLEVLRRAERELGTPLVYVDCDTRWRSLPLAELEALHAPVGEARSPMYLHLFEEEVSAGSAPSYFQLLMRKRAALAARQLRAQPPWQVWNVGTIGVPAGAEGFFDEALALNDELLPEARVRRTIEQLALALVACDRFELRPFDHRLTHYWNYGYELPVVLRRFFDRLPTGLGVEQLAQACAEYEPPQSELLAVRQTEAFRRDMRQNKYAKSRDKRRIALKAQWLRLQRRLGWIPPVEVPPPTRIVRR